MSALNLQTIIDDAWEQRDTITPATKGEIADAIETTLDELDSGRLRIAEKIDGAWQVHQWAKKAVLLCFRLYDMAPIPGGPTDASRGPAPWFDKLPSKFAGWDEARFRAAGFRAVPNCVVRRSAYIASGADVTRTVVMPRSAAGSRLRAMSSNRMAPLGSMPWLAIKAW